MLLGRPESKLCVQLPVQVQAALSSAADPDAVEAKEKHEQAKLAAQVRRDASNS